MADLSAREAVARAICKTSRGCGRYENPCLLQPRCVCLEVADAALAALAIDDEAVEAAGTAILNSLRISLHGETITEDNVGEWHFKHCARAALNAALNTWRK